MQITRRDFLLAGGMAATGTAIGKPTRSSIGVRQLTELDDGQGGYTASSYIQDGLEVLWDGIENIGYGMHDFNSTHWVNLAGNSSFDMTVQPSWNDVGLVFDGTWCAKAPKSDLRFCTIECVCSGVERSTNYLCFGWSYQGSDQRRSILINPSAQLVRCYLDSRTFDGIFIDNIFSSSISLGGNGSTIFLNGEQNMKSNLVSSSGITFNRFRLAGYGTKSDGDAPEFFYRGTVFRCAIYSRALSAEEIAYNYMIDKARFNLP